MCPICASNDPKTAPEIEQQSVEMVGLTERELLNYHDVCKKRGLIGVRFFECILTPDCKGITHINFECVFFLYCFENKTPESV